MSPEADSTYFGAPTDKVLQVLDMIEREFPASRPDLIDGLSEISRVLETNPRRKEVFDAVVMLDEACGESGIDAMRRQRRRQMVDCGHTMERDWAVYQTKPWELIQAARCFEAAAESQLFDVAANVAETPLDWPWMDGAWKPREHAWENLELAGALLAAAYDVAKRLQDEHVGQFKNLGS